MQQQVFTTLVAFEILPELARFLFVFELSFLEDKIIS
jgi:hypothetical protein